jgi:hypothetical protein
VTTPLSSLSDVGSLLGGFGLSTSILHPSFSFDIMLVGQRSSHSVDRLLITYQKVG